MEIQAHKTNADHGKHGERISGDSLTRIDRDAVGRRRANPDNRSRRPAKGPAEILKETYSRYVTERAWHQEDHERLRRDGLAYAAPHIARTVAYGSRAGTADTAALHIVDACAGFGSLSLALLATIGDTGAAGGAARRRRSP